MNRWTQPDEILQKHMPW